MANRWISGGLTIAALAWASNALGAEVKVAPYGTTKDGHAVKAYTLVNDKGASATILDFGGTVSAIRVPDRDGKLANVVMSFADLSGWEALGHANAILGRVANRIQNGFTLDGVHYALPQQDARGVTMHSGPQRYAIRVWTVQPIKKEDGAAVTMTLDSPDGDQGFPGDVKIIATYRFGNDNALRLDMVATTDKPTVLNLTNHIYFNLNGNSTVPVYGEDLQVMTDQMAEVDPAIGPTGKLVSVVGTSSDFTKPTKISDHLALSLGTQYDVAATAPPVPANMLRSFNISFAIPDGDNRLDRIAARLHDPVTGRVLELKTTETSIQVFTPANEKDLISDAGKPFTRVPAIALETEHLPDSPNRPQFPSVVLRPGQTFHSTTIYSFTTDAKR
jgi:aldose 1-epimerase